MLALLFVLLLGMSGSRRSGAKKLPPPPTPDPKKLRERVCALVAAGHFVDGMLPLLLRELYPAVSWPAGEEWDRKDVGALPVDDRAKYDATKKELDRLLKRNKFIAECTDAMTPYAEGGVAIRDGDYVATWRYDHRIDDPGGNLRFDDLDVARTALLRALYFFGAPVSEADTFVEASMLPSGVRRSIWAMPGGGYRVVIVLEDDSSAGYQAATLDDARAIEGGG